MKNQRDVNYLPNLEKKLSFAFVKYEILDLNMVSSPHFLTKYTPKQNMSIKIKYHIFSTSMDVLLKIWKRSFEGPWKKWVGIWYHLGF